MGFAIPRAILYTHFPSVSQRGTWSPSTRALLCQRMSKWGQLKIGRKYDKKPLDGMWPEEIFRQEINFQERWHDPGKKNTAKESLCLKNPLNYRSSA